MFRSLPYIAVLLLCAACSIATPASMAEPPMPTFGAAGQSVLLTATAQSLQATAVIVQAQQAQGTAEAQQTLAAFNGVVLEATAQSIQRQATLDARHATEQYQADTQATAEQADHGTQTATAQVAANQYATQRAEADLVSQRNEAEANAKTFRLVVAVLVSAFAILIVSIAIGKWRWDSLQLQAERERLERERQNAAHLAQIQALRQALIEARVGTVFFDLATGRPTVLPPPGPTALLSSQSHIQSEAGQAATLIITEGDDKRTVPKRTAEEEEAVKQMLEFLDDAIACYGEGGHLESQVPSRETFKKAGIDRWASGAMWQDRRNLFGGWLISRSTGTFCPVRFPTLGELREAVLQGHIPVHLPTKVSVPA